MLLGAIKGGRRLTLDSRRNDFDVLAFALCQFGRQAACLLRFCASVCSFAINLMNSGARDVGECKTRVFCNCLFENRASVYPRRKNPIQPFAIGNRCRFGGGCKW